MGNRQQIWHYKKWQKHYTHLWAPWFGILYHIIWFDCMWIDPCINNPCMELAPCCWWPWLFSATSPRPILFSWKTVEHCTLHRTIAAVLHNETGAALQHRSWLVLQTINRWSCIITWKAPTRAFSWLKKATIAFTFKNLLRHYANQPTHPFDLCVGNPISCLLTVGSRSV